MGHYPRSWFANEGDPDLTRGSPNSHGELRKARQIRRFSPQNFHRKTNTPKKN